MTNRERVNAILHYQPADRVPVVAFGYWNETLQKWANEGHITQEQCDQYWDNSPADKEIMAKLGFDFNWNSCFGSHTGLRPGFKSEVLREEPDGSVIVRDGNGLIVRTKPGIVSIPSEIGTTLTDRTAWEEHYLPKLQYCDERVNWDGIRRELENDADRDIPLGLHCGSLYGDIRNLLAPVSELGLRLNEIRKMAEEMDRQRSEKEQKTEEPSDEPLSVEKIFQREQAEKAQKKADLMKAAENFRKKRSTQLKKK